jgi:hypothetical protein
MRPTWIRRLVQLFTLDTRALAVFRIGLGLLLLVDLYCRVQQLEVDYTDFGMVPREFVGQGIGVRHDWMPHMWSGSLAWQASLFALTALLAVWLTIGFHTTLATAGCWFLLASLHHRNDLLVDGGDCVFTGCLFWGSFVPLGEVWSVDARRRSQQGIVPRNTIASPGTLALVVQVFLIYFSAGFMKSGETWRQGTALFYALNLETFASPIGVRLLDYSHWLPAFAFAALYAERYGIFLLWCPFWQTRLRTILVLLGWTFHLTLVVIFELGLFPLVCIVAWIPLLPTPVWDWLAERKGRWRPSLAGSNVANLSASPQQLAQQSSWPVVGRDVFVSCMLVIVVITNLWASFPNYFTSHSPFPRFVTGTIDTFRLQRGWGLYAPDPGYRDGWFVATGKLANGQSVDLWNPGQEPTDDKPSLRTYFKNQRWKRLSFVLPDPRHKRTGEALLGWLVRRWNRDIAKSPAERCQRAELRYWIEVTDANKRLPWVERKLYEMDVSADK